MSVMASLPGGYEQLDRTACRAALVSRHLRSQERAFHRALISPKRTTRWVASWLRLRVGKFGATVLRGSVEAHPLLACSPSAGSEWVAILRDCLPFRVEHQYLSRSRCN